MFFQWISAPAKFALLAWSRRAEITADRAGMICCRKPEVAVRTMVKFALGSQKLYQEVDLDEYLSQLEGVKTGLGRLKELLRAHPYLPKRLQALRLFADSAPFRRRVLGLEDGTSKSELDKQVSQLISVL